MKEKPLSRRREMARLIGQYRKRTCTRKEFCEIHGIPESTLAWWLKRADQNPMPGKAKFIKVEPSQELQTRQIGFAHASHPVVEFSFPDGREIRYYGPVNIEDLRGLL